MKKIIINALIGCIGGLFYSLILLIFDKDITLLTFIVLAGLHFLQKTFKKENSIVLLTESLMFSFLALIIYLDYFIENPMVFYLLIVVSQIYGLIHIKIFG